MRKPYTQEQIDFLVECGKTMNPQQIMEVFNAKFNESRTKRGLRDFMTSKGISFVYTKNTWADGFTEDQKKFMFEYGSKVSRKKLTSMFNDQFHTQAPYATIKSWCNRHGIESVLGDCKFSSETSPRWQSGLSKDEFRGHYSDESFDRMTCAMRESNIKYSIGDEVVRHGIPHIVVNDTFCKGYDYRLQKKDRYAWEHANGPIPEDYMIIHLDNDPMNCELNNLRCIPTKYRTFLAKNGWWDCDKELKVTVLKWCELFYEVKECDV